MIAAGDQIVVASGMMPVTFWRKCPLVAERRGPVEENPNCHSACAAKVKARKNGKSIGIFLRSASVATWMAMMGLRAYPSPQYKYDATPDARKATMVV